MAQFAKELYALNPCCASPKPVAAASSRLRLITLAGGEKGFVASKVGVEKGFAGHTHDDELGFFGCGY